MDSIVSVLLLLTIIAALVLLAVAGYRRFNRWYVGRRNGWRSGWEHVARSRRGW